MGRMNDDEAVRQQYANDDHLARRIQFHTRYSTNQQGMVPWLFSIYRFAPGDRILELGCGNGGQWEGRLGQLPDGCQLTLSDFSAGMVEIVRQKYATFPVVSFTQIDIQAIPCLDETFDVVIANHMLYHVPDLPGALVEVSRVLKPGGHFYAATNGDGGMRAFLHGAMKHLDPSSGAFGEPQPFSLQNGQSLLEPCFGQVQRLEYEDSLCVTDTRDLMDWLESTISITAFPQDALTGLYEQFEGIRVREGAIRIPKEVGLFLCVK